MSSAPRATAAAAGAEAWAEGPTRRPRRRWILAVGLIVVLGATGVVVAVTHPFAGGPSSSGAVDNASPTGLQTIAQRPLSSQTSVAGTLGYGGSSNVDTVSGTSEQALMQAQQQMSAAQANLAADRTSAADNETASNQTISQDRAAVGSAQHQLNADQAAQNTDCASQPSGQQCSTDKQVVSSDQAKLTQAQNTIARDELQGAQSRDQGNAKTSADEVALRDAKTALSIAQASAVNPGTIYTALPAVGAKVTQGQQLYAVDGIPVPLFYGSVTMWRDFTPGMSDGPDVGALTANLIALGFGDGLAQSNHFSAATQAGVERWQASIGAPRTGIVRLGDVVFEPGAVIVTAVTPDLGGVAQPGAIMKVTSTTREVVVDLDAAQQSEVKVGDKVAITLPNNQTTAGTVSFVGSVATTPSSNGGNNNATPTIEVDITLDDPSATGNLDQAPVEVAVTTATVDNALVVPVTALVALAGGGYAIEVVDASGVHHLVAVQLGLFDDADGLVQITGSGLSAGQQVVVPSR